jgi:acetoin utilization deacetylase AcuC-like enzyme
MSRSIHGTCEALGIPLGCVLEGGYGLGALARSVAATLVALGEPGPAPARAEDDPAPPLVGQARERLAQWWPALA